MIKPSDQQLAAMKRLTELQEGRYLMEWLDANLQLVVLGMENEEDLTHLRFKQGASKTLRHLIRTITDAKETIHKRKEINV